ncbi:MAG: hypothetical protein ACLUQW_10000 [Collinsella sp.]
MAARLYRQLRRRRPHRQPRPRLYGRLRRPRPALENRRVTTYTGNYSSYLKQREDNLEQMRAKRAARSATSPTCRSVDSPASPPRPPRRRSIRRSKQIKGARHPPRGPQHIDFKFPIRRAPAAWS